MARKPIRNPEEKMAAEINAARALRESLGQDADDAELLADMIEGETSLIELVEATLELVRQDEELLSGIQARQKDLADRKERIDYRMKGRKAKIEQAILIFGEKIELPEETLSLRNNPDKLEVYDESEVPSQFYKVKDPVLDRASLTQALRALGPDDEEIPGARLVPQAQSMTVRKK
jgi:hypothetical protein